MNNLPPPYSDHEILLLLRQEVQQMSGLLKSALDQLQQGNRKFEQIAQEQQAMQQAIVDVRQTNTRTQGTALTAQKDAEINRLAIEPLKADVADLNRVVFGEKEAEQPGIAARLKLVEKDVDVWRYWAKLVGVAAGVAIAVLTALLVAAANQAIFP